MRELVIKNKITEKDLNKFMKFKVPNKAIGFFSDNYSADKESFRDQLANDAHLWNSVVALVPTAVGEKTLEEMVQKMEDVFSEYNEEGFEYAVGLWNLGVNQVILIGCEAGSSDGLNFELKNLLGNQGLVISYEDMDITEILNDLIPEKEEYLTNKGVVLPPNLEAALTLIK